MFSCRSGLLALTAAALLSGCAAPARQRLEPEASAARIEQRSLQDPQLRAFLDASGLPYQGSWDIDRLTLAALYFRPEMKVADAQLELAKAGIKTARERPNPLGNFSVERASPADLASPWTIGAAIGIVLELFHKRGERIEQASDLARAARHDLAATAWLVRGGVRSAVLDMGAATAQLSIARERLAVETELARLFDDRLRLGAASSIDRAEADAARQQAALGVANDEHQLSAARAALAAALGVPLSTLDGAKIEDPALAAPKPLVDLGALRHEALTGRADIHAALARYDAADAVVRLELTKRIPDLTLGPSYSYDQGQNKIGLNASAVLPVFNQSGGPIAEARARRQFAAAQFEALQSVVLGKIDSASADYEASALQLAASDQLVASDEGWLEMMRKQFTAGKVDRIALLGAQANLLAAKQARLTALEIRQKAFGALEDAVQVPLIGGLDHLPALVAGATRKDVK